MRKLFLYSVVFFMAAVSAGCGKKGGDSNPSAPVVSGTISFTQSGSPVANSVYLTEAAKKDNEVTLSLKVKGGSNVFGAVVEITYNSSLVSFVSASEGTYLNQGGNETIFAYSLNNGQEGILLLGCDRKGKVPGANGDGELAKIILKAKTNQSNTAIGFNAANSALKLPKSTSGSTTVISGTKWFGGNLSY